MLLPQNFQSFQYNVLNAIGLQRCRNFTLYREMKMKLARTCLFLIVVCCMIKTVGIPVVLLNDRVVTK